jgi:AraC-like DNA-binding protein
MVTENQLFEMIENSVSLPKFFRKISKTFFMKVKKHFFFCFFTLLPILGSVLYAQNPPKFAEDYQKWDLDHLLSVIDANGLNKENKEKYIEHYLQKAKKEKNVLHIEWAYRNKIWFYKDYETQQIYADSLLQFAQQQNDNKIIGVAYNMKRYIESQARNYEMSLIYSLQAEKYLKKSDDYHTLNEIRSFIGTDYYRFGNYRISYLYYYYPAFYFKKQSETQTNPVQAYNNFRGYVFCLYGMSKTAYRLPEKKDTIPVLLSSLEKAINNLKPKDIAFEKPYFLLVSGMYCHDKKEYEKSDTFLQQALKSLHQNGDYVGENLAQLFLGKNAWEQGNKSEAVRYFVKTDSLYKMRNFINNELVEAYNYLIAYSKETQNKKDEIYYTDTQLKILKDLQEKNNRMSALLQENTGIDDLKKSTQIQNNIMWWKIILVVFLVLGLFVFSYLYKQKDKRLELSESQENEQEITSEKLSDNINVILEKLAVFEENKGFLQDDLTLDDLARKIRSNRTDVSKVISEYKGGFNAYIYKLRIDYIVECLENDPVLRIQNIGTIALKAGFKNRKTFTNAFKNERNIVFSEYLEKLRNKYP